MAQRYAFLTPPKTTTSGKNRCTQYVNGTICKDPSGKVISDTTPGGTNKTTGAQKGVLKASGSAGAGKAPVGTKTTVSAKVDPNKFDYGKNPASGCGNCNPNADIFNRAGCELGKLSCEAGAAASGSSNAVQQGAGAAGKTIQDSVLGSANAIQEAVLGQSHAVQDTLGKWYQQLADWSADAGWNLQQGGMNAMIPILVVGGIVILFIAVIKR